MPQLFAGLALYGASQALMIRGQLGLGPWDALHAGLSEKLGLNFGVTVILVSVAVLVLWIPLRQRIGVGTVANTVCVGLAADGALALIPPVAALGPRIALLVAGVVLNGIATAYYIGARLGPGARDGLMTGLAERTGASLRLVRTLIEITVLAAGWLLGGTVGVGTALYAVAIGPVAQFAMPHVVWRERRV
ncbi:membrane protein [Salinifilum aidingensis]